MKWQHIRLVLLNNTVNSWSQDPFVWVMYVIWIHWYIDAYYNCIAIVCFLLSQLDLTCIPVNNLKTLDQFGNKRLSCQYIKKVFFSVLKLVLFSRSPDSYNLSHCVTVWLLMEDFHFAWHLCERFLLIDQCLSLTNYLASALSQLLIVDWY